MAAERLKSGPAMLKSGLAAAPGTELCQVTRAKSISALRRLQAVSQGRGRWRFRRGNAQRQQPDYARRGGFGQITLWIRAFRDGRPLGCTDLRRIAMGASGGRRLRIGVRLWLAERPRMGSKNAVFDSRISRDAPNAPERRMSLAANDQANVKAMQPAGLKVSLREGCRGLPTGRAARSGR